MTSRNKPRQRVQQGHLERVAERIANAVLESCRLKQHFHMAELTAFVQSRVGVAPDSPGRILRLLRQAGKINYCVVDRRSFIYVLEPTQHPAPASAETLPPATGLLFSPAELTRTERHRDDG